MKIHADYCTCQQQIAAANTITLIRLSILPSNGLKDSETAGHKRCTKLELY